MLNNIFNFTFEALEIHLASIGLEKYRAKQIFDFIYNKCVNSFEEISVLKKADRSLLKEHFVIPVLQVNSNTGSDGTTKFLFKLNDDRAVESVLIPMDEDKYTICVSTQVGCKMNCKFCATAKLGFARDLQVWEIVYQIYYIYSKIIKRYTTKVPNIVFMGMGEPLDNYDNTLKAIKILNCEYGLSISKRRITLSTCGLVPQIEKLKLDLPYINLAISLNATDNMKRSALMPVNEKYPIEQLINSVKNFPIPHRKRITFEYVMIEKFNDTGKDIQNLIKLLNQIKCKINLIPLNKHLFNSNMKPSSSGRIEEFAQKLRDKNMFVTLRQSKGESIKAACGMLVATMS